MSLGTAQRVLWASDATCASRAMSAPLWHGCCSAFLAGGQSHIQGFSDAVRWLSRHWVVHLCRIEHEMGRTVSRHPDPAAEGERGEIASLYRALSHELRSPLGSVLNFAAILELDHGAKLDPAAREVIARIRRSADGAVLLLDALNRLAAVERAELQPEVLSLEPLARIAFANVRRPEPPGGARARRSPGCRGGPRAPARRARGAVRERDQVLGDPREGDGRAERLAERRPAHRAVRPRRGHRLRPALTRRSSSRSSNASTRARPIPAPGSGLALVRRVAERHGGPLLGGGRPRRGARFFLELPAPREVGG